MKICKYMFVWQPCQGSTTVSKVYAVTSRFILDQRIVAYKEIEHCFHSCAAFSTWIRLVASCSVQATSPPKRKPVFNADLQQEYPFFKKLYLAQRFGAICVPLVSVLFMGGGGGGAFYLGPDGAKKKGVWFLNRVFLV
jgi:hypothetical protein